MTHVVPETKTVLIDDSRAGTMVVTSVQERTVVSTVTTIPTAGVVNMNTAQPASMNNGALAGMIVGIVVAIAGVGVFVYLLLQRKKENTQEQLQSQPLHTIMSPPPMQHQFYPPTFVPAHQPHVSAQYQQQVSHHPQVSSQFQQPTMFVNHPSPYAHSHQLQSHQHPAYQPESMHLPAVTQVPTNVDSKYGSVNSQSTPSHLRQASTDSRTQPTNALIIGQNGLPQMSEHSSNDSRTGTHNETTPARVLSPAPLQGPKFQGPASPSVSRQIPTPLQQSPHSQVQQLAYVQQSQFNSPQLLFDGGSPRNNILSPNSPQTTTVKSAMPRDNCSSEYNTTGLNVSAIDKPGHYSCFANAHGYRLGQEGMHTPAQASEVSPSMYDSGVGSPSPMESKFPVPSTPENAYTNWHNHNKRMSQGLAINLDDHDESVITDDPVHPALRRYPSRENTPLNMF